jgi:hypothetical protein
MKNYICDNTEYFFGNGYIALPVEIEDLPKTIDINGKTLLVKSSFHVSLVCVKNIVSKYGEDFEQKVIEFFCDFVSKNKIYSLNYVDEFRYAIDKETGRETVIVICNVSNIKEFFESLNKEYGFDLEMPPTHITLYTLEQDKGIGLNTGSDLETKTSVITEQILPEIKNKFVAK